MKNKSYLLSKKDENQEKWEVTEFEGDPTDVHKNIVVKSAASKYRDGQTVMLVPFGVSFISVVSLSEINMTREQLQAIVDEEMG